MFIVSALSNMGAWI